MGRFEWDEAKNASNILKRGVSFPLRADPHVAGTDASVDDAHCGAHMATVLVQEIVPRPQHVAMAADGRLVIPAGVRSELGLQDGGTFIVHVQDGQIRLEPIHAAVARAQAIVRRYVPETASLVADLSEERRSEAAAESE